MGLQDGGPQSRVGVAELLEQVLTLGASDLHLTAGAKPTVRVNGRLGPLEDYPVLQPAETQAMIYSILTQRQRERLESEQELDCAHALPGKARFRLNVYFQRDSVGAAFRLIPQEIKPLEALGIPPQVSSLARLPRGFVLVTGPTGSGKSTTLASMVDLANREREDHIMTVEDPIEFLHSHKRCLVNQREVGEDTKSFANALTHVLRQDPDIILVGELRDLETISIALTAAETGHLVFATVHTQDAPQTVDRMIDVFPTNQQQQIRVQLAGALQGVVCQQLVPTADGNGRVVGVEIMMATPAIRNLIRDGKTHQVCTRPCRPVAATACRPWTSPWPTSSAAATSATTRAWSAAATPRTTTASAGGRPRRRRPCRPATRTRSGTVRARWPPGRWRPRARRRSSAGCASSATPPSRSSPRRAPPQDRGPHPRHRPGHAQGPGRVLTPVRHHDQLRPFRCCGP
jgi:twitching motility protein PilT